MSQKWKLVIILLSIVLMLCTESNTIKPIEESMEIIDLLMNRNVSAPKFTVDTAVQSVPVTYDLLLSDGLLSSDNGTDYLQVGDNFTVLSMGYVLPLSFELYSVQAGGLNENPAFILQTIDRVVFVESLEPDQIYIPLPNYEMNFGTFYDNPGKEVALRVQMRHDMEVSMVGVNPALHGETFRIPVFAKILHNLELIL